MMTPELELGSLHESDTRSRTAPMNTDEHSWAEDSQSGQAPAQSDTGADPGRSEGNRPWPW